jgi:hypothetical protein
VTRNSAPATNACPGDWLLLGAPTGERAGRRGEILEVRGTEHDRLYLVRWLDTDRESLIGPGPGSHIITRVALIAGEQRDATRLARIQDEILATRRDS